MKKEVLRCLHFLSGMETDEPAFDISFYLYQKEVLGLLGLSEYEKNKFFGYLAGIRSGRQNQACLMLNDEVFTPSSPQQSNAERIFCIRHNISDFPEMSILENIVIIPGKPERSVFTGRKKLPSELVQLTDKFLPGISVSTKLGDLTRCQRYMINLLKAVYFDARVVIMDIFWDALNQKDSQRLQEMICYLKGEGMAFVVLVRNVDKVCEIFDRLTVFNKGNAVRTFDKRDFSRQKVIECLKDAEEKAFGEECHNKVQMKNVLVIKKMKISGRPGEYSLCLRQGEAVGLIDFEKYDFMSLADALLGLRVHSQEELLLDGKACGLSTPQEACNSGVYLFHSPTDQEHSFAALDPRENIMIPWERRSSYPGGFLRSKLLDREYEDLIRVHGFSISDTNYTNRDKLSMMFLQMRLLNSKLIIFKNPTKGLNYQDAEFVRQQMRKLVSEGKSAIVVSSDIREINVCCDRYYNIQAGRMLEEIQCVKRGV